MNPEKWRVVRHESLFRKLPYPWHVYPPGVPVPANPIRNNREYVKVLTSHHAGHMVRIHRTHAEAFAEATIEARNDARKAATTL